MREPAKPTPEEIAAKLQAENATLRNIIRDFHWMARRYADGRSSYAPGMFNRHVQALINIDFEFADNAPRFARDGMGRDFDGLTEADTRAAEADMPRAFQQHVEESTRRKQRLVNDAAEAEREATVAFLRREAVTTPINDQERWQVLKGVADVIEGGGLLPWNADKHPIKVRP